MLQTPHPRVRQILQTVSDANASINKIGQLISEHGALSEDILRYANSSVLGFGREIPDTKRALLLLGVSTIANLVACHAVSRSVARSEETDAMMDSFWEDATRRAVIARKLSARYSQVSPEYAFVVGLSLEFGSLMQAMDNTGAPFIPREIRGSWGDTRLERERDLYGVTHTTAFVEEAANWYIPQKILRAVSGSELRDSTEDRIAGWADQLSQVFTASEPLEALNSALDIMSSEAGMNSEQVYELLSDVDAQMLNAGRMLGVTLPKLESWDEVRKRCQAAKPVEEMSRHELLQLATTLRNSRGKMESENDKLRAEIIRLGSFDKLTGLPNRKRYLETLRKELGRARRRDRPLSLMLVDIDSFTNINQRYGEVVGDEILQKVGEILCRVVRESEAVSRIGPDAFALLLPEVNAQGGRVYAERVRAALESMKFAREDRRIRISGTVIGVSLDTLPDTIAQDHERLHCFALKALNAAQTNGNNHASWAA